MKNLYRRLEELLPLPLCCCEHNDLVANFMLEYPGHDDGDPATCQNDYGATRDSLGPRAPTPCPRKRSPCPAAGCSAPARTSTRAIAFRCPLVLKYNFSSGVATEWATRLDAEDGTKSVAGTAIEPRIRAPPPQPLHLHRHGAGLLVPRGDTLQPHDTRRMPLTSRGLLRALWNSAKVRWQIYWTHGTSACPAVTSTSTSVTLIIGTCW